MSVKMAYRKQETLESDMTIKQLEAKLANAKTARERAEINAAIAFIRKQAAVKKAEAAAEAPFLGGQKGSGMSKEEYSSFHGC